MWARSVTGELQVNQSSNQSGKVFQFFGVEIRKTREPKERLRRGTVSTIDTID